MEEVFEDKVLDDLFMVRSDGFESSFIKQYGEPEEIKNAKQSEEVLINAVKELIQDNEVQKMIIEKIHEFKEDMIDEECFWMKQYYKLGISDGISLRMELRDMPIVYNEKVTMKVREDEMFFDADSSQFRSYIEEEKIYLALKDPGYKSLVYKIEEIKRQNQQIQKLFKGEIVQISIEDCRDLQNIITLEYEKRKREEKAIYYKGGVAVIKLVKQTTLYEEFEKKQNQESKKKKK